VVGAAPTNIAKLKLIVESNSVDIDVADIEGGQGAIADKGFLSRSIGP
jgi:hypothetical protein